jgi:hypothetical protein
MPFFVRCAEMDHSVLSSLSSLYVIFATSSRSGAPFYCSVFNSLDVGPLRRAFLILSCGPTRTRWARFQDSSAFRAVLMGTPAIGLFSLMFTVPG